MKSPLAILPSSDLTEKFHAAAMCAVLLMSVGLWLSGCGEPAMELSVVERTVGASQPASVLQDPPR